MHLIIIINCPFVGTLLLLLILHVILTPFSLTQVSFMTFITSENALLVTLKLENEELVERVKQFLQLILLNYIAKFR